MTSRNKALVLTAGLAITVIFGGSMVSYTSGKKVHAKCTVEAGTNLTSDFAASFCELLESEINKSEPSSANPANLEIVLARAGEFAISADVTIRSDVRPEYNQKYSLSVRDSNLQPSIAKTLVYPILKILE